MEQIPNVKTSLDLIAALVKLDLKRIMVSAPISMNVLRSHVAVLDHFVQILKDLILVHAWRDLLKMAISVLISMSARTNHAVRALLAKIPLVHTSVSVLLGMFSMRMENVLTSTNVRQAITTVASMANALTLKVLLTASAKTDGLETESSVTMSTSVMMSSLAQKTLHARISLDLTHVLVIRVTPVMAKHARISTNVKERIIAVKTHIAQILMGLTSADVTMDSLATVNYA